MVRKNVQSIMKNYDQSYEESTISEEEFVYDSLQNNELFKIMSKTNIKALHLANEVDKEWDEPDEEFIKVVITDGKNDQDLGDNTKKDQVLS